MANDFIKLNLSDANARFAGDVKRATILTRDLIDLLEALVDRGYRQFEPNPVDFSGFETINGIPTGSGQAVWDMLNGALGALKGTMQNEQALNLKNRVG